MTGKDLIVYILQHDLVNEPIFKDGRFLDFMTIPEAAAKTNVGPFTIATWISQGAIDHICIGSEILVSGDFNLEY